jgi:hypothetical protein
VFTQQDESLRARVNRLLVDHGFVPDEDLPGSWFKQKDDLRIVANFEIEYDGPTIHFQAFGGDELRLEKHVVLAETDEVVEEMMEALELAMQ